MDLDYSNKFEHSQKVADILVFAKFMIDINYHGCKFYKIIYWTYRTCKWITDSKQIELILNYKVIHRYKVKTVRGDTMWKFADVYLPCGFCKKCFFVLT